jgi:CBS domain containing-hemolysin-like protein
MSVTASLVAIALLIVASAFLSMAEMSLAASRRLRQLASMVAPEDEELIVRRDDGSFLADGVTPIPDLQRALGIETWPQAGQYDTLAGFLMVMLRRIPRRTDRTEWDGWRFEVMDVDSHRVDQVMVTRVEPRPDPQSA